MRTRKELLSLELSAADYELQLIIDEYCIKHLGNTSESLNKANSMYKAAKEIFAPKEKIDPPGKWTHDDLTGKEFGNEYQKWNGEMWRKIFTCFKEDAVRYMSFASFLDKDYCAPINAWSLKNWTGIQKWHESLANYKDVSFLDFLIKFYSAPTPKE